MNLSKRHFTELLVVCSLLFLCIAGCDPTNGQQSLAMRTRYSEVEQKTITDDEKLKELLDEVIRDCYFERELNTEDHAAWQILHGVLAYGKEFLVRVGKEGKLVRVVDHLAAGGQMNGWTMRPGDFYTVGKEKRQGVIAVLESGSGTGQGHADQWVAVLAQCDLPLDWSFKLPRYDREFTMADLIYQIKQDVYEGKELSWTIIALNNYLKLDEQWYVNDENSGDETANSSRKPWSLRRIIDLESEEEINESACGGTHRLIGITMCLNRYIDEKRELTGSWLKAADVVANHGGRNGLAHQYQQRGGSFSSHYFLRPGYSSDLGTRLGTTGHTLEFLSIALDDKELREPWVKKAAIHMCEIFRTTKGEPLDCGKLYHAMHGVVLYRERLFGKLDGEFKKWAEELLAKDKQKQVAAKK